MLLFSLPNWECYLCEARDADNDATADGRVFFTVPKLFECSLSLQGGKKNDGWFFVHVEFLFNVGGDHTGMQGIPYLLWFLCIFLIL